MHDAAWGPILAASAVGTNPEMYATGTAKLLRAGSIITLQVHYTPYGEASTDQIGVGLVFAKEAPTVQLKMVPFSKQGFTHPAAGLRSRGRGIPRVQEGRDHLEHRPPRAPARQELALRDDRP